MIKISIITVCYNSEKTIEKTIQSVLQQKYDDLEYVVIDGGSTDRTLDIIAKYRDKIDVCISEPDNGIYDAMNKGVALSTGDVLAFLNSDDWYAEEAISKVITYFENNNVDMVGGNIYTVEDEIIRKRIQKEYEKNDIFYTMAYPHPSLFVKRELFEKYGKFDTSYQVAADYKWILNVLMNKATILCVQDYFTYFRIGGLSTTKRYQSYKEQYEISKEYAIRYQIPIENEIDDYYSKILFNIESDKRYKDAMKNRREEIREILNNEQGYYIWGTGIRGRKCQELFEELKVPIIGYIDTYKKEENIGQYKVYLPVEIEKNHMICITPKAYVEEIMEMIEDLKLDMNRCLTYDDVHSIILKIGRFEE